MRLWSQPGPVSGPEKANPGVHRSSVAAGSAGAGVSGWGNWRRSGEGECGSAELRGLPGGGAQSVDQQVEEHRRSDRSNKGNEGETHQGSHFQPGRHRPGSRHMGIPPPAKATRTPRYGRSRTRLGPNQHPSISADIACRRLAELSRSVTRHHRRVWSGPRGRPPPEQGTASAGPQRATARLGRARRG